MESLDSRPIRLIGAKLAEAPTLSLDAIRSVTPGINARDLAEWFRREPAAIPPWARNTLLPLLRKAGFDERKPIHLLPQSEARGVTLYQP